MTGEEFARAEIAAGRAEGRALWVLLSDPHERDGYALKPDPWEGSGQYQHVIFEDGRDVFVKVDRSLPTDWGRRYDHHCDARVRHWIERARNITKATKETT